MVLALVIVLAGLAAYALWHVRTVEMADAATALNLGLTCGDVEVRDEAWQALNRFSGARVRWTLMPPVAGAVGGEDACTQAHREIVGNTGVGRFLRVRPTERAADE